MSLHPEGSGCCSASVGGGARGGGQHSFGFISQPVEHNPASDQIPVCIPTGHGARTVLDLTCVGWELFIHLESSSRADDDRKRRADSFVGTSMLVSSLGSSWLRVIFSSVRVTGAGVGSCCRKLVAMAV